jgi:Flp pilus assembly protein TadD
VSPQARVYSIVGACAIGAAAAVVGITAATHHSPPKPKQVCSQQTRAQAGSVAANQARVAAQPRSGAARLELGIALVCAGQLDAARVAWRAAARLAPDGPAGVRAGNLLHPNAPPGLPQFQPSFTNPTSPAEELLLKGAQLHQLQRPISAERAYKAALALAPNNVEANVAAAVGLFDKDDPTPAFSHLGPLVRRFPHAQTVRFHLGLLSIWIGQFAQARTELQFAVRDDPKSQFAREAKLLLSRLGKVGTG